MADRVKPKFTAQVIVVSDTCFRDSSKDKSGWFVRNRLEGWPMFSNVGLFYIDDDYDNIKDLVRKLVDQDHPNLVITVGGTGLSPRDVTPEATTSLYDKSCTGIVAALHLTSLGHTPLGALTRLSSGIIGSTLVINFPGGEMACRQCLDCIERFIVHALDQIRSDQQAVKQTHSQLKTQDENRTGGSNKKRRWYGPRRIQPNGPNQANQPRRQQAGDQNSAPRSYVPPPPRAPLGQQQHQQHQQQSRVQPSQNRQPDQHSGAREQPKVVQNGPAPAKKKQPQEQLAGQSLTTSPRVPLSTRSVFNQVMERVTEPAATSSIRLATQLGSPVKLEPEGGESSSVRYRLSQSPLTSSAPRQSGPIVAKKLARESEYPMISYEDALKKMEDFSLLEPLRPTQTKMKFSVIDHQSAIRALNNVLANDLTNFRPMPAFRVSTVDGYVVRRPKRMTKTFELSGRVQATLLDSLEMVDEFSQSQAHDSLAFCYQVNTGGRLPDDEDFIVVPTEKAIRSSAGNRVDLLELKKGSYVRERGSDMGMDFVLKSGTIIGPPELSIILSMGYKEFEVFRRPRIGILSTGDELLSVSEADFVRKFRSQPELVVDVNCPLLSTLLSIHKYPVVSLGTARDDPDEIENKLRSAIVSDRADVIIVTGGASMGTRDWVKDVIRERFEDSEIHFGRVNMKPGKPVAFASIPNKSTGRIMPLFSLPGNPVSAYVTTQVLVLPYLELNFRKNFKYKEPLDLTLVGDVMRVIVDEICDKHMAYKFDGRLEFARAKTLAGPNADGIVPVRVSYAQQSSRLLSLKDVDCLLLVSSDRKGTQFAIGDIFIACKLKRHI